MRAYTVVTACLLAATVSASPSDPEQARLTAAFEQLDRGVDTFFPDDVRLDSISRVGDTFVVHLGGSFGLATDELIEELRLETVLGLLVASEVDASLNVRVADGFGGYRALGVDSPPVVNMPPIRGQTPNVMRALQLPFGGALAGKRIALSAGHGWFLRSGVWRTQRSRWKFAQSCGTCRGIVEDFFSTELYSDHLIPLLRSMGAEVVLVRDPDHASTGDRIVDHTDDGYSETGVFSTSTEGGYRYSSASDASYTFDLNPSVTGRKRVALRWVHGANRTAEAIVEVEHAGGTSRFSIVQRQHGDQWFDLGDFWFEAGHGRVVVSNASTGVLVAGAARLQGGVFADADKPMWEMAAESYVPWAGAPSTITGRSDPTIRPGYAEFVGADAYIALHSNAAGASPSSATGTVTYRYSCKQYDNGTPSTTASACDSPAGSKRLTELVHDSIISRMRADWDPNWRDRGAKVANFGEVRMLSTMPGALIESAFHDNLANPTAAPGMDPPRVADNRAMHDPRWRDTLALAVADALAKYFDPTAGLPPDRPEGLVARNLPDGTLELLWRPASGATGYRVQRIDDPRAGRDRAWDEGVPVTDTRVVFTDLEPGRTYAFRVSSANANGEGYFSQAVVARFRGPSNFEEPQAEVLHVHAFNRRDAWIQTIDNDFAHAVEHAQALMGVTHADVYFDGALGSAVEAGAVSLDGYRVVDFAAGKNSTEHGAVSRPMQTLLRSYVDAGGALIVSGEEIAWHLGNRPDGPEDGLFFSEILGARYVADSANAYDMTGVSGGAFDGVEARFDDGSGGVFEVFYPDVIAPVGSATTALTWPDGRAAAVLNGRVLYVGSSLGAIVPVSARAAFYDRALQVVDPGLVEATTEPEEVDSEEGGTDANTDGGTDIIDEVPTEDEPPVVVEHAGCGCGCGTSPAGFLMLVGLLSLRRRA